MTARDKFLALATVAISIPIVYKVSPCTAFGMAAMLLAVIYLACNEINRR
ncbi:unnamed protein product [marine sediment metagenome]|uniref:Uncharacterized protein n=1 Tax=marine sediment metagenome TaxID=412755 RepID=X0T153_9ZZZZ